MTRDDALERAAAIPGWMSPSELAWLYDRASECETVVEVGVFCGRSTFALAAGVKGHVVAIDSFVGVPEMAVMVPEVVGGELRQIRTSRELEAAARHFLGETLKSGKLVLSPETSESWLDTTNQYRAFRSETSPIFAERYVDMLFIDGDHSRAGVEQDLKLTRWLKTGGLLCGHDFDEEGVTQAIDHLDYEVIPGGRIWYLEWKGWM